MTFPKHEVSIVIGGVEIKGFDKYQIRASIVDPVGSFSISRPFDFEVWERCVPDEVVRVFIDKTPTLVGRIDDESEDDNLIELTGRCNVGRLYDDCTETINYGGLGLKDLITKLVKPFFEFVVFTNVKDRSLRRGKGKKARAGNEPALIAGRKKTGTQIEPGQTRWQVLETLLDQTGLLAWSSADGRTLIVSQPNYSQEPQFRFFRPAPISKRAAESNVLSMRLKRSTGERYSRVLVVGSGPGTEVNFGAASAARYGEAKDNELTVDGDGIDFSAPKRLIVQRSIASLDEASELAHREMAKRDTQGDVITVRCPGHGQQLGTGVTLFAPDTLALVEDERTRTSAIYSIVTCVYQASRSQPAETTMDLVRLGSVLA